MTDELYQSISMSAVDEMASLRADLQAAISQMTMAASETRACFAEIMSVIPGHIHESVKLAVVEEREMSRLNFDALASALQATLDFHTTRIEAHDARLECHDIDIAGRPTRSQFDSLVTRTERELHEMTMTLAGVDSRLSRIEVAPGDKALKTMAAIGAIIATATVAIGAPAAIEWVKRMIVRGTP